MSSRGAAPARGSCAHPKLTPKTNLKQRDHDGSVPSPRLPKPRSRGSLEDRCRGARDCPSPTAWPTAEGRPRDNRSPTNSATTRQLPVGRTRIQHTGRHRSGLAPARPTRLAIGPGAPARRCDRPGRRRTRGCHAHERSPMQSSALRLLQRRKRSLAKCTLPHLRGASFGLSACWSRRGSGCASRALSSPFASSRYGGARCRLVRRMLPVADGVGETEWR